MKLPVSPFLDIVGSLITFSPHSWHELWIPGYRGEPVLVTACGRESQSSRSARITFLHEGGLWRRWVSHLDFSRVARVEEGE